MDTSNETNQREFSRVPIKLEACLKTLDYEVQSKSTRDLSMKGLFMECDQPLDRGTLCDVTLLLSGVESPMEVTVRGMVARSEDDGLAIQFTELGLESYDHLHNLVMLNAPDPGKVEQEMKEHVGIKKR